MFWSGQSFDVPGLEKDGNFKAASKRYNSVDEVDTDQLQKWLVDGVNIQWDYKNIVKRKGELIRI